jgi:hypothetical protein
VLRNAACWIALLFGVWHRCRPRMGYESSVVQSHSSRSLQRVGGAARVLHKGTNGWWEGVVSCEDLARYDAMVETLFTPDLAYWVSNGRAGGIQEALRSYLGNQRI